MNIEKCLTATAKSQFDPIIDFQKLASSAEFDCMTVNNGQLELSLRVPEKYCGRKFQYFEFCGFLYSNCISICISMYIVTEKAYQITSDNEIS